MILTASEVSSLADTLMKWEYAEYCFTALVVMACFGEYAADFTDWFTGGIEERKKRLAKRSTLLLIGSLALELVCLVKTNQLSGMLIGSLSEKAGAAETKAQSALDKAGVAGNKAGDAKDAADKAQGKTDTVSKQADALALRMTSASGQLGKIEHEIFIQSPRWSLLAKVAPELAKRLAPFAGQRVDIFVCGRFGSQDGETMSTWGAVAGMLETDGAKWKVEHGGLEYFDRGCSPSGSQPLGQGITVYVSKGASSTTMEAARVLGDGLAKALPPSPDKTPSIIDPDFSKRFSQPIEGKDTPWAMVANDPGLITVLIGAHPQR